MKKTKEQRKDEAQKAYCAIQIPAWETYEAIEGPAWEAYQAINVPAKQTYQTIEGPAKQTYQAIEGPAWNIYRAKCEEIDEEIVEEDEDIKTIDGKRYKLIKDKK